MRTRLVSFVLRATAPSAALGLVLAASLIVVESLVVYLVNQVAPGNAFRVIYLLGVVLVSTGWGSGWRWRRHQPAQEIPSPARVTPETSIGPPAYHR